MPFRTMTEYLTALFAPLKNILLAYVLSGGAITEVSSLSGHLGLTDELDNAEAAWARYIQEEEMLITRVDETVSSGMILPFEHLCGVFGLNPFERFALTLTLAAETDPVYGAAVAAMGNPPTQSLLLRLFSASAEECAGWQIEWLRRSDSLRLIFTGTGLMDPVSLRPTVKRFVLGVDAVPEGVSLFTPSSLLPESLAACAAVKMIAHPLKTRQEGNLFILTSPPGAGKKYQLKRFAREQQVPLLIVPYERIQDGTEWLDALAAYLVLSGGFLCIDGLPPGGLPEKVRGLIHSIRPNNLFITGEALTVSAPDGYNTVLIEIPLPDNLERLAIWSAYASVYRLPDGLDRFASQYRFTIGQIEQACRLARDWTLQQGSETVTETQLHEACRHQLPNGLARLAISAETRFTWEDMVLPPAQIDLLRHICNQVIYRDKVYCEWGFDEKVVYGRGVRAIFTGPPGTGKTMAAQVVASELHRPLYKVDLSSLVSKYIGDTEKNLDEVFGQAEKSGGILFFDEADAIFGRRGEQNDSHEKYANMQAAFLLQRFEDFDGVALLATNLIANMDPAFARRIQNRVDFPIPTREYRQRIWDKLLRHKVPLAEEIDIPFFADNFELTGASIKNIILQAAFLSAPTGHGIGMGELVNALIMEYAKTDKILPRQDLGEYGYYLEGR